MGENKESPSEIDSRRVISVLNTLKKRKLQAEQLGLPTLKHKCWDRAVASDGPFAKFYGSHEVTKGKRKGLAMDDRSERESMKDSNSFAEDSDSATSAYNGAKMEAENVKIYDSPSSSSPSCGTESLENTNSPLDSLNVRKADSREEELAFDSSQHEERMQAYLNLEEQLIEFGNHGDYITSEHGDEELEQRTDKELEDILYTNGLNPNVYVLSSGRWSVNQEAQSDSRKPTIDQEFEQYFSMLML
ncbi:hypothetical protein PanWU01x14_311780 [Parasponia andersonii]|uniref:Uncharacterized protein n=1 Tax=Parasponia andersonii TaxID=3476 RepID=A0A2P5APW0_PARAD|nr:hypothetical protein PanWU01x14_311780 [Parasponia andersonii]